MTHTYQTAWRAVLGFFFILAAIAALPQAAHANDVYCTFDPANPARADFMVDPVTTGFHIHSTLQAAIYDAQAYGDIDGDGTVEICVNTNPAGTGHTYVENASLSLSPWNSVINGSPTDPVLIYSPAVSTVAFEPVTSGVSILTVNAPVGSTRLGTVQNLTFQNGVAGSGGAIYATYANLSLVDLVFESNQAGGHGGAVYIVQGDLSVSNSEFYENRGANGAAIHAQTSMLNVSGSHFQEGTATGTGPINGGGAIYFDDSSGSVSDSVFIENRAQNGAAIEVYNGSVAIDQVYALLNQADGYGGFVDVRIGQVNVNDTNAESNQATFGGAFSVRTDSSLAAQNVELTTNEADQGGAVYQVLDTVVTVEESTIDANTALIGGGFYANGHMTMLNLTGNDIYNNSATEVASGGGAVFIGYNRATTRLVSDQNSYEANSGVRGGAIRCVKCTVLSTGDSFAANSSLQEGAGVYLQQNFEANFTEAEFLGNYASSGSGIYASQSVFSVTSNLDIVNSFFDANGLGNWGGGLYATGEYLDVYVSKSTFQNHTVVEGGGGIYFKGNDLQLIDSTVQNNYATAGPDGSGAGLYYDPSPLYTSKVYISGGSMDGNVAQEDGGAIYASAESQWPYGPMMGEIEFYEVSFNSNAAVDEGGAIYISYMPATVNEVNGRRNKAYTGGFIYNERNTIVGSGIRMDQNIAETVSGGLARGGGLSLYQATATLDNVRADGNMCQTTGGGDCAAGAIYMMLSPITITNSRFTDNTSDTQGGAWWSAGTDVDMQNVLFARNNAVSTGSAVYAGSGDMIMRNVTMAGNGNALPQPNAAFYGTLYDITIADSVFAFNDGYEMELTWFNLSINDTDIYDTSGLDVDPAIIPAFTAGSGNLSVDPQFIGNGGTDTNPLITPYPLTFNYLLQAGSPATGMGIY